MSETLSKICPRCGLKTAVSHRVVTGREKDDWTCPHPSLIPIYKSIEDSIPDGLHGIDGLEARFEDNYQ